MIQKIKYVIILVIVAIGLYLGWMLIFDGGTVKLYFATKDGMYLTTESRKVKGDQIEGVLQGLIDGPTQSDLSPTIPQEVKLLNIKITDGVAVVNFNEKLVTNHWGGSTGEVLTVYSIVNTLCQFNGIDQVQILVEGRKIETLAGHIILDETLEWNQDLIK